MLILSLLWIASTDQDAAPTAPPRTREISIGGGAASEGPFLLISWTSRTRVGVYGKIFLLDHDKDARPNSTVVEESGSELGVTFRVNRLVTLGAGIGHYSRDTTVYGNRVILVVPFTQVLEETEESDTGLAGLVVFSVPTNSKARFSLAVSRGPAGFGGSVGVTIGF